MLLQTLYRELNQLNMMAVDNIAIGSIIKQTFVVSFMLLDQVTKQNIVWNIRDIEVV